MASPEARSWEAAAWGCGIIGAAWVAAGLPAMPFMVGCALRMAWSYWQLRRNR